MIELRDYQKSISDRAATILKENGIAYLSMQVRTGKTLTALATAMKFGAKDILFITKKKAIPSIKQDCDLLGVKLVCVINYESVQKATGNYDLIIVDEAHSLGAFPVPSQRTRKIREIVGKKPVLFLSGTPSPESYAQLFHQFWVSLNSPFAKDCGTGVRAFYKFAKQYCSVEDKLLNGFMVKDYSKGDKDRIMDVVFPYFITYTQEQAGFRSEINEHVLECRAGAELTNIFKRLRIDRCYTDRNIGLNILADTPANLINKLNQLSGGTVIDADGESRILDAFKVEAIYERFKGKKIAVFYVYKSERKLLFDYFGDEATDIPELFQSGDYRVFIGQIRSVREGVRLDRADAIIFYSMEFSYLSYEQGRNRLMSKERSNPAEVYFCASNMGMEKKILMAVRSKQDFTLQYYLKHDKDSTGEQGTIFHHSENEEGRMDGDKDRPVQ